MNVATSVGLSTGDPAQDAAIQHVYVNEADAPPIAVEVTRGGMVESVHRAIVAICDAKGAIVRGWGEVERPIYARSAINPLQTIPVIESGAADAFALGDDEITLCYASHQGEDIHVDRVGGWLGRLGLGGTIWNAARNCPVTRRRKTRCSVLERLLAVLTITAWESIQGC
jgi:L-asparaginase II